MRGRTTRATSEKTHPVLRIRTLATPGLFRLTWLSPRPLEVTHSKAGVRFPLQKISPDVGTFRFFEVVTEPVPLASSRNLTRPNSQLGSGGITRPYGCYMGAALTERACPKRVSAWRYCARHVDESAVRRQRLSKPDMSGSTVAPSTSWACHWRLSPFRNGKGGIERRTPG